MTKLGRITLSRLNEYKIAKARFEGSPVLETCIGQFSSVDVRPFMAELVGVSKQNFVLHIPSDASS